MDELFSLELLQNQLKHLFTIYRLSENLFQAKSELEIIVLWKTNENWEGVSNMGESAFIEQIGYAIDKHYSKTNMA